MTTFADQAAHFGMANGNGLKWLDDLLDITLTLQLGTNS